MAQLSKDTSKELIGAFKVVLLGATGVGKTSLVRRFVNLDFQYNVDSTIGCAFSERTLEVNGGLAKFHIWDTAGQERFQSLTPMYYRKAHAAIVVYDITKGWTYGRAIDYIDELELHAIPEIVVAFVGNKSDLACQRQVAYGRGFMYAKEKHILFKEASALANSNVNELLTTVAEKVVETFPNERKGGSGRIGAPVKLELFSRRKSKHSGCCSKWSRSGLRSLYTHANTKAWYANMHVGTTCLNSFDRKYVRKTINPVIHACILQKF